MKARVLHIAKTKSLLHDSRILKWLESLETAGLQSDLIVLEDSNERRKYDIGDSEVYSDRLWSRKLFPKNGSGYLFKIPEYTFRYFTKLFRKRNYDLYIFHDNQVYGLLLLLVLAKPLFKGKVVWDLHELFHGVLLKNTLAKRVLRFILGKVDLIVYTNHERREYIQQQLQFLQKDSYVLNNYPSSAFGKAARKELPTFLNDALEGSPYVLWMGAAAANRNFIPFIKAMNHYSDRYKVVVMGSVNADVTAELQTLPKNFLISQFVDQEEIPSYIDHAEFSVVLYKNSSMNNWICEPNRLYQLAVRHKPSIVGNNPTMKNFIEEIIGGVILEDDGSDEVLLRNAIARLMDPDAIRYYEYQMKNYRTEEQFVWNRQVIGLIEKLQNILNKR